jgi:hypothetical protein
VANGFVELYYLAQRKGFRLVRIDTEYRLFVDNGTGVVGTERNTNVFDSMDKVREFLLPKGSVTEK